MNYDLLLRQIELNEGFRKNPYKDTEGITTIGIGRNLDHVGISHDEAMYLLKNDVDKSIKEITKYSWFNELSDVRQRVVIDMVFNLGIHGFLKFDKTIMHIKNKRYRLAASEMLNSKWAWQTGARARRLAMMMETDMDDYFLIGDE